MALKGVRAASRGNATHLVRAVPRVAALAVVVMVMASCSSKSTSSGSSDGGVSVAPSTTATPVLGAPVDVVLGDTQGLGGPMSLTLFTSTAAAGDVTFNVKNAGTIEHEMIVLKTDTPFDQIPVADSGDPPVPVTSGADKVDEADNVGESGEPNLAPGGTRTFTAAGLTAGKYVLLCNIAKHYGLGMRAAFTVT